MNVSVTLAKRKDENEESPAVLALKATHGIAGSQWSSGSLSSTCSKCSFTASLSPAILPKSSLPGKHRKEKPASTAAVSSMAWMGGDKHVEPTQGSKGQAFLRSHLSFPHCQLDHGFSWRRAKGTSLLSTLPCPEVPSKCLVDGAGS